jgi:predicted acyltransferase
MVNLENIDAAQLLIRKEYWQILMALAFMLIWNNYRSPMVFGVVPTILVKILGWIILAFLASIYQSSSGNWMMIHWWGILGLIGWAYLLVALLYLWIGDKVWWLAAASIGLLLLNVNEFVRLLGFDFQLLISASTHASVMLGVLTTVIYTQLAAKAQLKLLVPSLIGIALLLIAFGFATRPEWGISKIRATPSWTAICAGISILAFVLLHFIADVKGQTSWAAIIAPAGSSTLTCYLMPYFAYAIVELLGWSLPAVLTDGLIGLLKSTLFALLVIQFTGLLNRVHIGLKI